MVTLSGWEGEVRGDGTRTFQGLSHLGACPARAPNFQTSSSLTLSKSFSCSFFEMLATCGRYLVS